MWKAALVSPINADDSRLQRSGQNPGIAKARGLIMIAHVHWRSLAPSSEPLLVCTVDPLPARKEACSLTLQASFSWSFGISVKCADKDQPLTPLTHDVPTDIAANVFTNVSAVEVAEPAEPNFPGVKVQRCN